MDTQMEQFVAQADGASPQAAAELIQQATAAPGLFAFGELLDLASVKALEVGLAVFARHVIAWLPFNSRSEGSKPNTARHVIECRSTQQT
jgi:hypothetical protein